MEFTNIQIQRLLHCLYLDDTLAGENFIKESFNPTDYSLQHVMEYLKSAWKIALATVQKEISIKNMSGKKIIIALNYMIADKRISYGRLMTIFAFVSCVYSAQKHTNKKQIVDKIMFILDQTNLCELINRNGGFQTMLSNQVKHYRLS